MKIHIFLSIAAIFVAGWTAAIYPMNDEQHGNNEELNFEYIENWTNDQDTHSEDSDIDYNDLLNCCIEGDENKLGNIIQTAGDKIDWDIGFNSDDLVGTLLHFAVCHGHIKICEILLRNGADINSQSLDGDTPLHIATRENFSDIIQLFIKNGAQLNIINADSLTPFACACFYNNIEAAKILFKELLKLNNNDTSLVINGVIDEGNTPLHYACEGGSLDIVTWLLKKGALCDIKNLDNQTALFLAVDQGNFDCVKNIISHMENNEFNFDINCIENNKTLLISAILANNLDFVLFLIERSVDLELSIQKNEFTHISPLFATCGIGNIKIVEALISAGANLAKNYLDCLIYACFKGNYSVAEYIVLFCKENKLNINVDNIDTNPLCIAATNGDVDMVAMLIQHGALQIISAAEQASTNKHDDLAKVLKSIIFSSESEYVDVLVYGNNSQCSICLEEFKTNNICYQLPCKHLFHTKCLRQWKKETCPNCRAINNLNPKLVLYKNNNE